MTTRGIRRKKSSLSEVKIAVVGAESVGKSALTVRFLTRRYIGEYDHLTENRYRHEAMVDNEPVLFEILDVSTKNGSNATESSSTTATTTITTPNTSDIQQLEAWADGILLVYSITDRDSFNYIRKTKESFHTDSTVSTMLVGNKVDMVHLRQVSTDEGEILAKDFECKFLEVSAAEHVEKTQDCFHELCQEVLANKRKSKQSLLDRMLGGARVYSRGKSDSALPKD